MTTLWELKEIACNPAIEWRMQRIFEIDHNALSRTVYEQEHDKAEIKQLSKEIQEILKNVNERMKEQERA